MAPSMESHESEVATTLDLTDLPPTSPELQILHFNFVVGLFTGPFKRFSPGLITQPIANEVCIALDSMLA